MSSQHYPLVINFFGGPGAGKSSMGLGVTSKCKWRGVEAEYVPEVPKDYVYEENWSVLENQIKLLGEQWQRVFRLVKHRKIIITDSPIILQTLYNKRYQTEFDAMVKVLHNTYPTMNYLLRRCKKYDPQGRYQTEEEAKGLDQVALQQLIKFGVPYKIIDGTEANEELVYQDILEYITKAGE